MSCHIKCNRHHPCLRFGLHSSEWPEAGQDMYWALGNSDEHLWPHSLELEPSLWEPDRVKNKNSSD